MKIIPATEKYEGIENVYRISFCYLHGQLQDDVGYDIFGFLDFIREFEKDKDGSHYIEPGVLEDGMYPCEFEGKPCTFFYWNSDGGRYGRHRGLVVYDDDEGASNYAKECFTNKDEHL